MLQITIVSNSGHDGDVLNANGTFQDVLERYMAENTDQADCITIVIRKECAINTFDLHFS